MALTLAVLLYPYWAFLVLFVIFALVDVYHMVRFGTYGLSNYIALATFLAGTTVILWGTFTLLAPVDFSQPLGMIGSSGSGGTPSLDVGF